MPTLYQRLIIATSIFFMASLMTCDAQSVENRPQLIVGASTAQPGTYASDPSISADGNLVAFWSNIPSVLPNVPNATSNVFVRNRRQQITILVSTTRDGRSGTSPSVTPVISRDGAYVAFESLSGVLTGAAEGQRVIMLKNINNGELRSVSPATLADTFNVESFQPSLSGDGGKVAFWSLLTGKDGSAFICYVRDLVSGKLIRVDTGRQGDGDGACFTPVLSADGQFAVFTSYATNLVGGVTALPAVYRKNLGTGAIDLVSKTQNGAAADGPSFNGAISSDGQLIAFSSQASNLAAVWPSTTNVYLSNLKAGTISLVSADRLGNPAFDRNRQISFAHTAAISDDGRYVAFETAASNLGTADANNASDIFRKDMNGGEIVPIACSDRGIAASGSSGPVMDGSGSILAFNASSANLLSPPADLIPIGPSVFVVERPTCEQNAAANQFSGWWWRPGEPGSGYAIEMNSAGDKILVGMNLFAANGSATWYQSTPDRKGPRQFVGTLFQYTGGQTLDGPFKAPVAQSVGSLSVSFSTPFAATVSIVRPNLADVTFAIERFE
jgi:Tol biopolymer transport system component